mgnify:CR=1 FL=1
MTDASTMPESTGGADSAEGEGLVRTIGIYLYPWADALDVVGPWEVMSAWAGLLEQAGAPSASGLDLFTVADSLEPVIVGGLLLTPTHVWASAPDLDLLIVPGGCTTMMEDLVGAPARLRSLSESGTVIASVCTGTKLLADAGLVDGRSVTTHWQYADELRSHPGGLIVDREARFIDHGDVVTSAGVSAGIDMALHLVRRFAGEVIARDVRRALQYDPAPPV